jgi:hypothetical protein
VGGTSADTKDFYVCMSTQREFVERKTKGGRTMRMAHRAQSNAVQLRSLWLDIDVKDGHHENGYDDLATAARALRALCATLVSLAPPLWLRLVLAAYIATGVWRLLSILLRGSRLAQALAEATRRFGLKADTAVTVDSARVMRLPDTKHSRSGKLAEMPISQVLAHDYTLDQMRHASAPTWARR